MNRTFRTLSSLAIVVLCLAPPATAAPEIAIGGRVVGPGGLPFPDAEVRLVPFLGPLERVRSEAVETEIEPEILARSGREGSFRFEAPEPGNWRVRVEAPGFLPAEMLLLPLLEPVVLPDVELVPDVELTVRVRAGGEPVPGARVQVRSTAGRLGRLLDRLGGGTWTTPTRNTVTAADGTATLPRSEGERLELTVSAPGYAFEGPVHPRGTSLEISLRPQAGREVHVVDANGDGIPGVLLTVGAHDHPVGWTDDRGHATVPVPRDGDVELVARGPGARESSARVARSREDDPPRRVVLPSRVLVVGKVLDAGNRAPVAGALVWPVGEPWRMARADRAGGFVIEGGEAERLRLVAGAPGYLRSSERELVLTDDGRPGPALALRPAAAVEGRVVDESGEPVPGAEVGAEVKRPPTGMIRIEIGGAPGPPARARTDSRGRFRISPLDPEDAYTVSARAEGHAEGRQDVLGLEPRRTATDVLIRLPRGWTVTGTVTDPEGNALEGARVRLRPSEQSRGMGGRHVVIGGSGPEDAGEAWSDGEGRFWMEGVRAATYDLEARRAGFAPGRTQGIEVGPPAGADPVDVGTIELPPGAAVQGTVLDPDGAPIEGVEIRVRQGGAGGMAGMMMFGGPERAREPDAVTGPDGWFVVSDLEPGTAATLTFSSAGWVGKTEAGVEVPPVEPLSVTLDPSSIVEGRVVGPEGEPIPRAGVELTRSVTSGGGGRMFRFVSMESTQADGEGRFRFEDVDPGTISLAAEATGWQKAERDGIEVPKGRDVTGVELNLEPGAILVGRVTAPDGRGAVGATVREVSTSGEPFDVRFGDAETDGDGFYRLEGLAPTEMSIEATHPSHVRTVRDVALEPGINYLDLQFEGGQEVTGTVTDPSGMPVAGAWVGLGQSGRRWGGPQSTTGPEGRFRIEGVADGDYTLEARAEGYAPYRDERSFEVAGEPVTGLAVTLESGEVLSGRVLNVDPDDYAEIDVEAVGLAGQGFAESPVDSGGRYRLPDLAPGRYRVVARQGRTGRQAAGETVIERGSGENRLDLEFGRGITLTGTALLGERPFTGASVLALGLDVRGEAWGETDREGRFRLEGLEAGRYRVDLRDWRSGISYEEEIQIDGDRDVRLDIPTAVVSGRVLDAVDRSPLSGARVSLASPEESGPSVLNTLVGVTDLEGRFRIGNVPDGNRVLTAGLDGYAAATLDVYVQDGRDVNDLRIEMDPTEGLSLRVRADGGAVPRSVRAAVLDGAGRPVVRGTYDTGEAGSLRLPTVPAGTWELVLAASGAGTLRSMVAAPGGPVDVQLPPACTLQVRVPELEGSGAVASATLVDGQGRTFRGLTGFGDPTTRWQLLGGRVEFASLPPGSWTIRVEASDGGAWEGQAATTPGAPANVVLE